MNRALDPTERTRILEVCEEILAAKLSIQQLFDAWPATLRNSHLLEPILDDLESAVEHAPGNLLTRTINEISWRSSHDYCLVLLYHTLLSRGASMAELMLAFEMSRARFRLDEQRVAHIVSEVLSRR